MPFPVQTDDNSTPPSGLRIDDIENRNGSDRQPSAPAGDGDTGFVDDSGRGAKDDAVFLRSPTSSMKAFGPAPMHNLYTAAMSYNGYTVTDGALRLIVLFNAARLGFSAIEIALMFSLYEVWYISTGCKGYQCRVYFAPTQDMQFISRATVAARFCAVCMCFYRAVLYCMYCRCCTMQQ